MQAILRELPPSAGEVIVHGKMAYTSQEPWVFGSTVRENILFGKEYDPEWFKKVVEACALKRDLELLPFGEYTLVGDRGN